MQLCKHQPYSVIDDVREPKYSTNQILIATRKVPNDIEHFIVRFTSCPSKPDWFYLSGKDIRKSKVQSNGRIDVYAVSLAKAQTFEQIKPCPHAD